MRSMVIHVQSHASTPCTNSVIPPDKYRLLTESGVLLKTIKGFSPPLRLRLSLLSSHLSSSSPPPLASLCPGCSSLVPLVFSKCFSLLFFLLSFSPSRVNPTLSSRWPPTSKLPQQLSAHLLHDNPLDTQTRYSIRIMIHLSTLSASSTASTLCSCPRTRTRSRAPTTSLSPSISTALC